MKKVKVIGHIFIFHLEVVLNGLVKFLKISVGCCASCT